MRMKSSKRLNLSELSIKRVGGAFATRIKEIPHFFAWSFSKRARTNKDYLIRFYNLHKGERCFLIANGPSLAQTDLSLIKDEISFGLNRIYVNFDKSPFRPTYYVASNDLVISQFHEDISKLAMPKFLNWHGRSFFEPTRDDIAYLQPTHVFGDYFQTDITRPMVFGATVTFVTLQLAYYMGFSEVIIIGMDHNFFEKGTPNVNETRNYQVDRSHFHPEYFPKGTVWQLPDLMRSELDYLIARDYYLKNGRNIFDATIGGKCQVFNKSVLSDFFK
jgi:hypothetical protein